MVLILAMHSVCFSEQQKKWITITTSVDASGNEVTTQVYGYYLNTDQADQVFVVCDPGTGEETGDAFVPGFEVGLRDVVVGYNIKYGEDYNSVKKINPVTIKMAAPNVFTSLKYSDYSYEQRKQTGNLYQSASGSAVWPGSTKGYLIPGADPDYWLIVNEVRNPNGWPVKVKVKSSLSAFRSSFTRGGQGVSHETEVYLEGYETKHILVNRGKPADCYFLADDIEDGDAWSVGRLLTDVTVNYDPELPERLKDSKGYIKFLYTVGSSQPHPIDLSGGFDIAYSLTCKDSKGDWYFDGRVKYTGNGWETIPSSDSRNTAVGKTGLESILNTSYSSGSLSGGAQTSEGFKILESRNVGAYLSNGPETQIVNAVGPALMDYSGKDKGTFDFNYENTPTFSRDGIPVLFYEPIFIEFYRFFPSDSAVDVGKLVKEVKLGFAITADTVKRPYISVDDKLLNYTVESVDTGTRKHKTSYWKITLNHHVALIAVNPDSYNVSFTDVSLALPNIHKAVSNFESTLGNSYDIDVDVSSPNYDSRDYKPTLASFDAINLGPGQYDVIYDHDVTTEIMIGRKVSINPDSEYDDVYLEEEEVREAVESAINYINWEGEAAFSGGSITFGKGDATEQILTLNRGDYKYRDDDRKKYYTREVGLFETNNKLLRPLSYFEGGVAASTTDELWTNLLVAKHLSGPLRNDDNIWPTYGYSDKRWRFYENLSDKY